MKRNVTIRLLEPWDKAIQKAAETVSLSFGPDPLLMWIYKSKDVRWDMLVPATQRWQEARLRHGALTGFLYSAVCNPGDPGFNHEDIVGVAHLHPPVSDWRVLRPRWWWQWIELFCLETFGFVKEACGNEQRVAQMYAGHNESFNKLTKPYPLRSVWYIVTAAVKPSAQGLGVGGRLMEAMLERVGEAPCFLECTNEKNVSFYEKYGFNLLDIGHLKDEKDPKHQINLYYMVRDHLSRK